MPESAQSSPAELSTADRSARQRWMSVLAKASPADLEARWRSLGEALSWACLRRPETGMVMVRGRAGGTGQRFNLGEMTVTRCAVALEAAQPEWATSPAATTATPSLPR